MKDKAKAIKLTPYDPETAEAVYSSLFCKGIDREDGLQEIPAASLQLVISALELIRWELCGDERDIIEDAAGIVERLRDSQKIREWGRK